MMVTDFCVAMQMFAPILGALLAVPLHLISVLEPVDKGLNKSSADPHTASMNHERLGLPTPPATAAGKSAAPRTESMQRNHDDHLDDDHLGLPTPPATGAGYHSVRSHAGAGAHPRGAVHRV